MIPEVNNIGPVDIVYTWVNGEDPDYIQLCRKYAEKPEEINPERYRDTYQFLKYSIRSVEKFAPWVRNIIIVTARPQVPQWLKIEHPKIRIVHHDEIIDQEYLPTFNYNTIESFIYKIPELSEHYIYMCDDFLFGNQVKRSDFYHDNKITIFGTLLGENLPFRIYERKNDIISLGLIEHNPIFYRKTYVNELQEHFKEQFHETRSSKFRANDNITMQKAYKYYMLKHQKEFSRPINIFDLKRIHTFHKIKNNLNKQIKQLDKLENKRPKFYCLNDDQRENPNPDVVKLVKEFLERSYPEKSSFERVK